jgi:hypothetical protein
MEQCSFGAHPAFSAHGRNATTHFHSEPFLALLTHKTLPIFRRGFKVRPLPKIQALINLKVMDALDFQGHAKHWNYETFHVDLRRPRPGGFHHFWRR